MKRLKRMIRGRSAGVYQGREAYERYLRDEYGIRTERGYNLDAFRGQF